MSKSVSARVEEHFLHAHFWVAGGLDVTGGGTGIVSHAGLVLLRQRADLAGQRVSSTSGNREPGVPGLQPRAPYGPVKA